MLTDTHVMVKEEIEKAKKLDVKEIVRHIISNEIANKGSATAKDLIEFAGYQTDIELGLIQLIHDAEIQFLPADESSVGFHRIIPGPNWKKTNVR